ncbi:hypothetical protein [Oceanicoccus sagamiensis]|uniref:hypothetical protein n=1 Tax=Oceanicoccus sagamiensis TaxID=716816 RepID=UPI001F0AB8BD|nr:hypothetical protein [Oceanicoccus sagamiensis]
MQNTDTLQPPSAAKSSIFDDSLGGWRKTKDKLANFTITAGGMAVLLAILLIFFYLLYEIMPLFKSASLEPVSSYSLEQGRGADSEPLYLAMEEQAEVAVQLRSNGQVDFFAANSGKTVKQFQLPLAAELTAFSLHSEQQPLLAMATGGDVLLAKPVYKISYPNDKRLITPQIEYPYGEESIAVSQGVINKIAVRDTEEQLLLLAEVDGQLEGVRFVKEEDFLTEEIVLEEEILDLPDIDINMEWLLVGPDQRWAYVVSKQGDYRVINLNSEEIVDSGRLIDKGEVSNVRFLLGEISLMISSDQGEIQQWFMVRGDGEPPRLQYIRSFQGGDKAIKLTAPEHRRKGFLAVDSDNTLAIYYTTSGRQLLSQSIADAASTISQLAVSPAPRHY